MGLAKTPLCQLPPPAELPSAITCPESPSTNHSLSNLQLGILWLVNPDISILFEPRCFIYNLPRISHAPAPFFFNKSGSLFGYSSTNTFTITYCCQRRTANACKLPCLRSCLPDNQTLCRNVDDLTVTHNITRRTGRNSQSQSFASSAAKSGQSTQQIWIFRKIAISHDDSPNSSGCGVSPAQSYIIHSSTSGR